VLIITVSVPKKVFIELPFCVKINIFTYIYKKAHPKKTLVKLQSKLTRLNRIHQKILLVSFQKHTRTVRKKIHIGHPQLYSWH
jgi:hypothetical protein